jgi:hypothetical protein
MVLRLYALLVPWTQLEDGWYGENAIFATMAAIKAWPATLLHVCAER